MGRALTNRDARKQQASTELLDCASLARPCPSVTLARCLGGTLAAALSMSCVGETCYPEGDPPQRYSGGITSDDRTFYQSSSVEGPYLFFPSGRTYQLEHGLRGTPDDYNMELSFSEFPFESGSGAGKPAGNLTMVEAINDDYIEVRNDTCAEYFLRLTASNHLDGARTTDAQADDTASDGAVSGGDAGAAPSDAGD